MGIGERSRARVEDLLGDLEGIYDAFPVNQTTLALGNERYEQARDQYVEGSVETYVELRNDDGEILHVRKNGRFGLPGIVGDPDDSLEHTVRRAVTAQAGVTLSIEGISEVTITGLSNADDDDAPILYRLLVVFDAEYSGGTPTEGAEWRPTRAAITPAIG